MAEQSYIPYAEIAERLGINPGEVLILASDITKLAFQAKRNEGAFDINEFIDSFKKKLTEKGTLVLPAFNFNLRPGDAFDLKQTVPATGAMPQAAFRRKEFIRTWHPLHSFMVWGKEAGKLGDLKNKSSFGSDSPFALFRDFNARMLFIGTSVAEAFTYTHHVEEQEKVPYRHFKHIRIRYFNDGEFLGNMVFLFYKKRPGWTMNLDLLQQQLESTVLEKYMVNMVECAMLSVAEADHVIRKDIRDNRARNIAHFESKLYLRDKVKLSLQRLNLYRTTQDKINYGTGIQ